MHNHRLENINGGHHFYDMSAFKIMVNNMFEVSMKFALSHTYDKS